MRRALVEKWWNFSLNVKYLLVLSSEKLPLKNEGKWGNGYCGKGMPIDNKDIVARSSVQRSLGDYVHARVAELERHHGYVRLCAFEETCEAHNSSFHFSFWLKKSRRKKKQEKKKREEWEKKLVEENTWHEWNSKAFALCCVFPIEMWYKLRYL